MCTYVTRGEQSLARCPRPCAVCLRPGAGGRVCSLAAVLRARPARVLAGEGEGERVAGSERERGEEGGREGVCPAPRGKKRVWVEGELKEGCVCVCLGVYLGEGWVGCGTRSPRSLRPWVAAVGAGEGTACGSECRAGPERRIHCGG